MRSKKSLVIGFLLVLTVSNTNVFARIVQPVTQPIGRLVRTYNTTGPLPFPVQPPPPHNQPYPIPTTKPIKEMNYICAQWDDEETTQTPPFDIRYPATEIILTKQQHFVRLLSNRKSSANGAWIMRSEYVRGRTPEDLRDIFALPNPPSGIVNVEMPASPDPATGKNYVLWTGIAGPIRGPGHDWGDGGSVQNRLVSDFNGTNYFPTYRFTNRTTRNHRQLLGEYALAYKPLACCGTARNVACCLDTYVPQAYSDLEDVYTALDYLNYSGYGSCPLSDALCQISPDRYDAVSFLAFRNAYLFDESIFEWQAYRHWEHRWLPCPEASGSETSQERQPTLWLQVVSEFNNERAAGCYHEFHYKTGGLIACVDWHIRHNLTCGISAAGMGNALDWCTCMGKVHSGTAQVGFYVNYFPKNFFIDGMVSGGGNWASTHRHIAFYQVCRTAYSHQAGGDFQASLQGGVTMIKGVTPSAQLAYVFNRQGSFKECGAHSLNLAVCAYNTHTLHAQFGVELNRVFEKSRFKVMPQMQLAWAGDFFLRPHILKAKIWGPTGRFGACGMHQTASYFSGSAELNFIFNTCKTLFLRYDAQVRSDYVINAVKLGLQASF